MRSTEDIHIVDVCNTSRNDMQCAGWLRIPRNGEHPFCEECAEALSRIRHQSSYGNAWNHLADALDLSVYTHPLRLSDKVIEAVKERDALLAALAQPKQGKEGGEW